MTEKGGRRGKGDVSSGAKKKRVRATPKTELRLLHARVRELEVWVRDLSVAVVTLCQQRGVDSVEVARLVTEVPLELPPWRKRGDDEPS